MAIIKCKECGAEVSSKAKACMKCGAKVTRQFGSGFVLLVLLMSGIYFVSQTSDHGPKKQEEQVIQEQLPNWTYSSSTDEMSGNKTHFAVTESTNAVNFAPPYDGYQRARLTIRTHPRYGKNIILSVDKGQLLCRSYEPCTSVIRFDGGSPEKYKGVGPDDGSTETVFIGSYSRFVGKLINSKTVRISVPVYQNGSPVFVFDTSNFDVKKYLE